MTVEFIGKTTDIIRDSRNEMIPSYEIAKLIGKIVDEEIKRILDGIGKKIDDLLEGKE